MLTSSSSCFLSALLLLDCVGKRPSVGCQFLPRFLISACRVCVCVCVCVRVCVCTCLNRAVRTGPCRASVALNRWSTERPRAKLWQKRFCSSVPRAGGTDDLSPDRQSRPAAVAQASAPPGQPTYVCRAWPGDHRTFNLCMFAFICPTLTVSTGIKIMTKLMDRFSFPLLSRSHSPKPSPPLVCYSWSRGFVQAICSGRVSHRPPYSWACVLIVSICCVWFCAAALLPTNWPFHCSPTTSPEQSSTPLPPAELPP